MAEKYRFDETSHLSMSMRLENLIQQYKDRITDLENLANKIMDSSEWQDVDVKGSFLSSLQTYIDSYKKFTLQMEAMCSYLRTKGIESSNIENAYIER